MKSAETQAAASPDVLVIVADGSETRFAVHTARGVWVYGETGWMNRTLLAGAGQQFLHAATFEFLHDRKPVGEVSREQAVSAAANVIEAAGRTGETDPPPSGIGGAVMRVYPLSLRAPSN